MHLLAKMSTVLSILLIYEHYMKYWICDKIGGQDETINVDTWIAEDNEASHTSEVLATTPDFVRKYGYPVETHTVTTEDGYLLTVHRIPGSPRAPSSGVKTPVLLMHGVFSASDHWVLMGPEKSLSFLLADQGYDVWIGNARGNFYSRKHVTLTPEDPKYWNFSWHEMGVYDLPAVIDHILKTTNHQQLSYVGHSMGTTMFFVLTSMKPEYNKKIRLNVSMAPAVFFTSVRSWLMKFGVAVFSPAYWLSKATGIYELVPRVKSLQNLVGRVCKDGHPLLKICMFLYSLLIGFNQELFYPDNAHVMFSHLLAGTSINTLLHYGQCYGADRFQEYDPTMTYGKFTAEYNLTLVEVPVYLIYAEDDLLFNPTAVMKVNRNLPNVIRLHRLPDDLVGHTDFLFAKNAKQLLYDEIITEINRYK